MSTYQCKHCMDDTVYNFEGIHNHVLGSHRRSLWLASFVTKDVYHIVREPTHGWFCQFCEQTLTAREWEKTITHIQSHGLCILANEPTPTTMGKVAGFGAHQRFWTGGNRSPAVGAPTGARYHRTFWWLPPTSSPIPPGHGMIAPSSTGGKVLPPEVSLTHAQVVELSYIQIEMMHITAEEYSGPFRDTGEHVRAVVDAILRKIGQQQPNQAQPSNGASSHEHPSPGVHEPIKRVESPLPPSSPPKDIYPSRGEHGALDHNNGSPPHVSSDLLVLTSSDEDEDGEASDHKGPPNRLIRQARSASFTSSEPMEKDELPKLEGDADDMQDVAEDGQSDSVGARLQVESNRTVAASVNERDVTMDERNPDSDDYFEAFGDISGPFPETLTDDAEAEWERRRLVD